MVYDKKGNTIKVGDVVRGTAHNIPHEIIGPVLEISDDMIFELAVGILEFHDFSAPPGTYCVSAANGGHAIPWAAWGSVQDFEVIKTVDGRPLFDPQANLNLEIPSTASIEHPPSPFDP